MEGNKTNSDHALTLRSRREGSITGVQDVHSFDEKEILLLTTEGRLMIKGEQLHVSRLNLEEGEVTLTGKVDSLVYQGKKPEREESLLKRLFR